ncbi:MAG: D-alanyl-D-alanine carboxypeptidase [Oscillospiraceae bacterium]|nr:D-alanyl-D-alanine carboxypeptidase [Oscillospiraceae bacterium]
MCIGFVLPVQAAELTVEAPSAILMEAATGTVLYEKQSHDRLPPASVTKVMTLLLVMEALESGRISWDDTVIASETAAAKGGSQVYLEQGEQMSMDEMLKSVVVSSANDCATALAEHIAGSEEAFVSMMNERAAELGMEDTHFVNCTGLDDEPNASEHKTSAYDIALMSRQLLQHEDIRKYTTIWMDTVRGGEFGLSNTNKLVRFYQGTTGLKTGYTSQAGHCLAASAMRDGVEYIAVVLNCSSSASRFQSAKQLLDYGFANYTLARPDPQVQIPPVPVILGKEDMILPEAKEQVQVLVEKSQCKDLSTTVEVQPQVRAPVEEGQRLGTLYLSSGGQTLAEIALVAPVGVGKQTWWDVTKQILQAVCFCKE